MNQELIAEVCQESEKTFQTKVKRMRENGKYRWDTTIFMAFDAMLASIKKLLVEQDVVGFKQYLYLAAKCVEANILAEPYNIPGSEHYSKTYFAAKLWADYRAFYWALISQDPGLAQSLAHLLGYKGEEWERPVDQFQADFGYLLKFLLLNEDEKAEKLFDFLRKKKMPKYWEGHLLMIEAILGQSQEKAQKALELVVKNHKRWDCGDVEKECSIPAMGLGWLAKHRGLDVFIDHPLAPGVVFERQEFAYPETDFFPKEIQDKTWQDLLEKRYP